MMNFLRRPKICMSVFCKDKKSEIYYSHRLNKLYCKHTRYAYYTTYEVLGMKSYIDSCVSAANDKIKNGSSIKSCVDFLEKKMLHYTEKYVDVHVTNYVSECNDYSNYGEKVINLFNGAR